MDRWSIHKHKDHLPLTSKKSDTDFDIGAFGLHKFTDDFAKLVSIRELSESCGRWEGRVRARRRGHALRGIHVMETAAESSDLLRTLQKQEESENKTWWKNKYAAQEVQSR